MNIGFPHLEKFHSHANVSDLFKDNIVQGVKSLTIHLTKFRMPTINTTTTTQHMLVRIQ